MAAGHTLALRAQASLSSAAQCRPRVSSAHKQAKLALVPSALSCISSLSGSHVYASTTGALSSVAIVQARAGHVHSGYLSSSKKRQAAKASAQAGQAAMLSSPPVQLKLASQYSSAAGQEALPARKHAYAESLTEGVGIEGLIAGIKVSIITAIMATAAWPAVSMQGCRALCSCLSSRR
jgi:hypothetical protein